MGKQPYESRTAQEPTAPAKGRRSAWKVTRGHQAQIYRKARRKLLAALAARKCHPTAAKPAAAMPVGLREAIAAGEIDWNGKRYRPELPTVELGPGPSLSETVIADRR